MKTWHPYLNLCCGNFTLTVVSLNRMWWLLLQQSHSLFYVLQCLVMCCFSSTSVNLLTSTLWQKIKELWVQSVAMLLGLLLCTAAKVLQCFLLEYFQEYSEKEKKNIDPDSSTESVWQLAKPIKFKYFISILTQIGVSVSIWQVMHLWGRWFWSLIIIYFLQILFFRMY